MANSLELEERAFKVRRFSPNQPWLHTFPPPQYTGSSQGSMRITVIIILFYILKQLPLHLALLYIDITHLILTSCNPVRDCYYPHCTAEETEEQRGGLCWGSSRNRVSSEGLVDVSLWMGRHSEAPSGSEERTSLRTESRQPNRAVLLGCSESSGKSVKALPSGFLPMSPVCQSQGKLAARWPRGCTLLLPPST